jgi:[ribosomal protein S5]-alanine N-acetyltransferase
VGRTFRSGGLAYPRTVVSIKGSPASARGSNAGEIELVRLPRIDAAELMELLNDRRVLRHMPLAGDDMSEADVHEWVRGKERHWEERGFGPWGIRIRGAFAGWGGFQPWGEDVEIALVLKPDFWGWGHAVFECLTGLAFEDLRLSHVVVLLPPSRARARGLLRLGFVRAGASELDGRSFLVYRLDAPPSRAR